ncbi:hypothetical protein LguiB_032037 [Lonicera macranthoides]
MAIYVDYSSNFFSSSIPVGIAYSLFFTFLFSIANNNLTGTIPISICNTGFLEVLDMSNNSLSGSIPLCLIKCKTLKVLNLGKNQLSGNIFGIFQENCGLQTLDLHENLLEGKVPESLANCTALKVLNLGTNRINDTFPCFLSNSSKLHVLVLRSNMFHGGIHCPGESQSWPNLQIIDIASNYFTGHLVPKQFLNWKAMMDATSDLKTEANHLRVRVLAFDSSYYQDTVTVTIKGQQMELVKILTIFTTIDFSNNYFEGEVPETIGELKSLYFLNLSHNSLTGSIPPLFGNLKKLESLDLSVNKLIGKIPPELAKSMSCLNFEYGEKWLQEKIKRDSARLTQLEIERRIRLNKVSKERLKSQPRKFKFEGEWDSGVTNGRHGGDVGESQVQDNNMGSIKKKTPLNDPEEWHKLGKMMEAYIEFHIRGSEEPSPNASSCKSNHCKEEEKPTISTPLSENKPEFDEIEEIKVMAEEGELWVEGVISNLQEEADEEVLVQVEEPQVQALPAISVDENEFFAKPRYDVRAELKNDNVEHIDFIGVDRFDVHPNFMLLDFLNKLRRIVLQYGLNFEEDEQNYLM